MVAGVSWRPHRVRRWLADSAVWDLLDHLCASLRGRTSLTLLALADRVPPRPAIRARAILAAFCAKVAALQLRLPAPPPWL